MLGAGGGVHVPPALRQLDDDPVVALARHPNQLGFIALGVQQGLEDVGVDNAVAGVGGQAVPDGVVAAAVGRVGDVVVDIIPDGLRVVGQGGSQLVDGGLGVLTVRLHRDLALAGAHVAGAVGSGVGDVVGAGLVQVQRGGVHGHVTGSVNVVRSGDTA